MLHDPNDPCDTRQRIMNAAGELFAEHGFKQTSVRDICSAAEVNLAAVNYHFRDKEGLYESILLCAHEQVETLYPIHTLEGTPQVRLEIFVRMLLLRLLGCGRPAWHGKLMAAEMANPTAALDKLVEQAIRPTISVLHEIVRELVGNVTDSDVQILAGCVLGQCLYYRHAKHVLDRLNAPQPVDEASIDALARHITEFSLAGIAHYRERQG